MKLTEKNIRSLIKKTQRQCEKKTKRLEKEVPEINPADELFSEMKRVPFK